MMLFRSCLYYLLALHTLIVVALLAPLGLLLPRKARHSLITSWNRSCLFFMRLCCSIDHEIEGLEQLPSGPYVLMSNHQSAWETIYLQTAVNPLATILKRELLFVPFFGWGLAMLQPIAIKRSSPKEAMQQVKRQGLARLSKNIPVLIFPEGTRTKHGESARYARGGAQLALAAGVPIVPVAHNAGQYWPAKSTPTTAGTIRLRFGPPISPADHTAASLTDECKQWIETTLAEFDSQQTS